jgi:Zn-dependent peptidase ImmA (M78 family)
LTIEEPEELDVREFTRGPRLEAAGLLDGAKKRIAVAKKFSPIIRRFTLAHEIAHYLLHGRQLLLREPPITDATFERPSKSIHEREANLFAAELLMPSFLVETVFTRLFGAPIDSSRIDENEAFRITSGKIPASALRKMSVRDLSKFVASNSSLTFKSDRPLAEIFQVSSTAMAIQLEELRLVRGD